MSTNNRTQTWMDALGTAVSAGPELPGSVLLAQGELPGHAGVYFVGVRPDAGNPFPRARQGEVGLLEGWGLSKAVHWIISQDENATVKTPIVAVVDVPSQAYGRREEALGIHLALAAAAAAYAQARLKGHPVIALLVGKAMSGGFLAHGYQANQIVALLDDGVMVHAMGKESAARVTLRTVEQLEALSARIPPMAYDIVNYASLGLLTGGSLQVGSAEQPDADDLQSVRTHLAGCIGQARKDGCGIDNRLGAANRQASAHVRTLMREQWLAG